MNSKVNDSNTNWVINGIKYAIFKRITPGLTHDLVGPLSVALIQAGIIKRKLKAETHQASELLENAVNLESYIKQTVLLIRAMKTWDAPNDHIFDASNVYKQCIKFFQTRLAMKEIHLNLIENSHEDAITNRFEAFLYSWLALLCYLEDSLHKPTDVCIEQVEENVISILLKESHATEVQSLRENLPQEVIGEQELQILSQHYATSFELNHQSILFKW